MLPRENILSLNTENLDDKNWCKAINYFEEIEPLKSDFSIESIETATK